MKTVLNAEIEIVRKRLLNLYQQQYEYLWTKPARFLDELKSAADHSMRAGETFDEIAAAKINHDICESVLKSRCKDLENASRR
jgi:hypothetical protein